MSRPYRRLRNTIRFMLANLSGFARRNALACQIPGWAFHAGPASESTICAGGYETFDFRAVNSPCSISAPMICRPLFRYPGTLYCDAAARAPPLRNRDR